MGSKELLSVDLVKEIINTKFNRYFKCLDIVNFIIAEREEVSLKYLMGCSRMNVDPYDEGRINLSGEVTWVLKSLRNVGYIEKYNRKMWRVVRVAVG